MGQSVANAAWMEFDDFHRTYPSFQLADELILQGGRERCHDRNPVPVATACGRADSPGRERCHDRNPVPVAREEREGNRATVILGDRLPQGLFSGLLGNQSVGYVRQIISYRWNV
jgi:hypothetical protein